jgi:hypothetical protein
VLGFGASKWQSVQQIGLRVLREFEGHAGRRRCRSRNGDEGERTFGCDDRKRPLEVSILILTMGVFRKVE